MLQEFTLVGEAQRLPFPDVALSVPHGLGHRVISDFRAPIIEERGFAIRVLGYRTLRLPTRCRGMAVPGVRACLDDQPFPLGVTIDRRN